MKRFLLLKCIPPGINNSELDIVKVVLVSLFFKRRMVNVVVTCQEGKLGKIKQSQNRRRFTS